MQSMIFNQLCLFAVALFLIGTFATPAQAKKRRILYNLDGGSHMYFKKGHYQPVPLTEEDLRNTVREATQPGSQLDTLLLCVNAQVMYYPTKAGTMLGALSEDRGNWPASVRQWVTNLESFYAQGVDPYAVIFDEANKRGLETLITFRMNDAHGNDFLRTAFWRDFPDYRLNNALDFGHEAVRDYVFSLIEEAVQRYNCDGVELDFNRFPTFFNKDTTEERIAKMNGLVERVRKMLDVEGQKRDKRLILAVRVPSDYGRLPTTYEKSREIGCDPVIWAEKGWIDFLTVSEFLHERYSLPIAEWKQLIRNIPIYGGIECTEGSSREQALTRDKYRRAARCRWDEGADGVYLFNFHTHREWQPDPFEPPFDLFNELGDPDILGAEKGRK